MTRHCSFVLSILALSIAGCVLAVQAETSSLRREFYGPSKPEFLVEYLEGHGSPQESAAQDERYQSVRPSNVERRLFGRGSILPGKGRWYVHEGKAEDDRFSRNLDQIGGGNLLRRGLVVEREGSYDGSRRWLPSRRNLDQIGGGNLLREADYRGERNLDSIGGGNLVRGLGGTADHLRRNLDQIGGGNLVRNVPDDGSREPAETRSARKQRDDQDDPADDRPRRVRPFARDTQARLSFGSTRYLADDYADESSAASKSIALSPVDRQLLERFVKRNIDEIDRTAFDNFFKRNLDEIDRVGWSGFVKRLADDVVTGDGRTNVLAQRG
ncbi:uncharacterized protein LOC117236266 [Bombus vosnesenskii]|uniref:Uncharacterized protein LOC117236266 n=1 Tax=Bombus vosnesenskii TaxID=207650 RepID=A0A6J3KSY8_9HYME|nr:uncharacterized protein LOC117236266 [Bombus vosnesenskii]